MVNTINVQYLTDAKGKQMAVQIPIETWKTISDHLPTFLEYMALRKSLIAGFEEVRRIQKGEQKPMSLEDFFNKLDD